MCRIRAMGRWVKSLMIYFMESFVLTNDWLFDADGQRQICRCVGRKNKIMVNLQLCTTMATWHRITSSIAFVRGLHRSLEISLQKGPPMRSFQSVLSSPSCWKNIFLSTMWRKICWPKIDSFRNVWLCPKYCDIWPSLHTRTKQSAVDKAMNYSHGNAWFSFCRFIL